MLQGPLAGLDFLRQSAEGCHVAKLLGCCEQPLHRHISAALSGRYHRIINIGCAEGYYAVGFAVAAPALVSVACDIDLKAQSVYGEMAEKNGVSDRVEIGGGLRQTLLQHIKARRRSFSATSRVWRGAT